MKNIITEAVEIVRNAYAAARLGLVTREQAQEVVLNTLEFVARQARSLLERN